MPDIIQETPAIEITPQGPQGEASVEADDSLTSHIETFHGLENEEAPHAEDKAPPQEKKRHRSFKNLARAEDVPRIKNLTAERDDWKAKFEALQKTATAAPVAAMTAPAPKTLAGPAQTGEAPKKPTWAQFEEHIGTTYDSWAAAQDAYADARDSWKDELAAHKASEAQASASRAEQEQAYQARQTAYSEKLSAYLQTHPDRQAAFQNIPNVNAPLMLETIWSLDDAPDVVYMLRQHPSLFDEMLLLTEGKPVSEAHVAATTKWLRSRLQGGTTGAPARVTTPVSPAPRPPTPVRTMPMPPADDPPSDTSSLSEHQRFFKTARR